MEVAHLNQKQLAARWCISEATLERWRSEGIGLRARTGYRLDLRRAYLDAGRSKKAPTIYGRGFGYWWCRRDRNPTHSLND